MFITPAQPHNSFNNILSKKNMNSYKNKKRLPVLKNTTSLTEKKLKTKNRNDSDQNVPKKTVLLEMKLQKIIRKNADDKLQSNKEHTKNLLQTQQMLADILKEYDHISKDKTILTAEIRNLKKYLSEVRLKLDQSLLVLNKNTTLFGMKKGLMEKYTQGKKKSSLTASSTKSKRSKKLKKKSEQIGPSIESILTKSN